MYVSYFCTDHADRKAQQTSSNAGRTSSKFKYERDGGMGCCLLTIHNMTKTHFQCKMWQQEGNKAYSLYMYI